MKQIDLRDFAVFSMKVPGSVLGHPEKKSTLWKVLAAHLGDFWIASGITCLVTYTASSVHDFFFVTKLLKRTDTFDVGFDFFMLSLPFIVFNYFFFSYFLNHGQTCSMSILKTRIKLESKGFFGSLKWASRSTLLCLTGGLTVLKEKDLWSEMKEHDYLYAELLAGIDSSTIHLLSRIEAQKVREQYPLEWRKAG